MSHSQGNREDEEVIKGVKKEEDVKVAVTVNDDVNYVDLDEYLLGVVAGEMPANFEKEALKAQVVASRTYVYNRNLSVDNTTNTQVYLDDSEMKKKWGDNYNEYYEKIKSAVAETKNEVMMYQGDYISALFFSSSNGYTENVEDYFDSSALPYLRSVDSHWDLTIDPKNTRQMTFTKSELESKFSCENLDFNIFKEHREVFFYQADKTNLLNVIKRIMDNYLSKGNALNNLQILIPLYQGIVGINEVNKFIQTNYNPHKEVMIKHSDLTFYPDDKVLQLQNDPEKGIMNGDIGYIVDIFADSVGVDFTGKIVRLASSDLDNLTLAYAISIHKSQGSEYENVIFPILSSYSLMLKRKLIYTAITRAKQKLIILGDLELLKHKSKIKEQLRNTSLMEFLEEKKEITPYDFM